MQVDGLKPSEAALAEPQAKPAKQDLAAGLAALAARPETWAAIAALAGIAFAFWPLLATLPGYWLDFEGYYAHGLLMIPAAAYIIWDRWDRIKSIPVKGAWPVLIFMLPVLYVAMLASRTVMPFLLSVLLVFTLLLAVWFVAGWRWMGALSPGVAFFGLGLPLLDRFVDKITFRLQLLSTDTAEQMLKVVGFRVLRLDAVVLRLDNFDLYIAEACSGLKTTIAVTAIVAFFMLTTKLKWWAHIILAVTAIPLSVLINGLRITMIGIVGNTQGPSAGLAFHDVSGYIALAVCGLILFQLSRFLEKKSEGRKPSGPMNSQPNLMGASS